jgi:hypothetical protein
MTKKPPKKKSNLLGYRIIQAADSLGLVDGQYTCDGQRDDIERVFWIGPQVTEARLPLVLKALIDQAAAGQ